MTDEWLALWVVAFIDTVVMETPLYVLFLRGSLERTPGRPGSRGGGILRAALVSLGLQLVTHPILWLLWPLASPHFAYAPLVVLAETYVVVAESALIVLVLGQRAWRRALVASFATNLVSTLAGLVDSPLRWLLYALLLVAIGVTLVVYRRLNARGGASRRAP